MKSENKVAKTPSYTLLIMGEHDCALACAEGLLAAEASIFQVFFYGEAVKIATLEPQMQLWQRRWLTLQQHYAIALWLCHDAALDWGVVAAGTAATVPAGFKLGSLGQFAEGCYHSDYVLSFGVQDDS